MESLVIDPAFWNGKTVLVTGHTGFKGSWLSLWLQELGANVIGFSNGMPSDPCLFTTAGVENGMASIIGDVRDLRAVQDCVNEHRPEVVFHLAAQSLVRESYADPIETYSTNVMGTVNVLEAIRLSDAVRAAIMVTSDKCYENREWLWGYREIEALGGHDPYSSSKGCAELVTAAYRASFLDTSGATGNTAVASVRAGNVIGGGDWANDRIIPDVIKSFQDNRPADIRNPQAVRPWQFVLEPLHGYLLLAERLWSRDQQFASAWNFGPEAGDARSVASIVEALADSWGDGAGWKPTGGDKSVHEATLLRLDSSKAATLLDWTPVISLDTTLEWIVEWYQAFLREGDAESITRTQLNRYHERVCA